MNEEYIEAILNEARRIKAERNGEFLRPDFARIAMLMETMPSIDSMSDDDFEHSALSSYARPYRLICSMRLERSSK